MMRKAIFYSSILFILIACEKEPSYNEANSSFSREINVDFEKKNGVISNAPIVNMIDQKKIDHLPVSITTIPFKDPTSFTFSSPEKTVKSTPIEVKIGDFQTIKVIDKPVVAIQSSPIQSLSMQMKDNATFNIQYLDVDQGLSSSTILSMLEDKSGNLWLGTKGRGVNRYDGKTFRYYSLKENFSGDNVWAILESKKGDIWFGTNGGATKYDGKYFTNYTSKEGLCGDDIRSIIEDKAGNIWFGSSEKGVSKYDGKKFINYSDKTGLSGNKVYSICEDRTGNIWFGSFGNGVCKFDGKSFYQYNQKKNGLISDFIWSIYEDDHGNIWFGSVQGVSKFDGKSFENYTEKQGLSNTYVLSIRGDKKGNIWFGTFGGGVNKFNGKNFTSYTRNEGMSNNYVWSILEDNSGNLWFGTDGGGVNKLNPNSFVYFAEKDGLSSNNIRSIYEDRNKHLWFGTFGGGLNEFNGKSFVHYQINEEPRNNYIFSILEDKQGAMWLGTYGAGVIKFDKNPAVKNKTNTIFNRYTFETGLGSDYIWPIVEDKKGRLWIGTEEGVSVYDGKSFTLYSTKQGLCEGKIVTIIEDIKGNIWLGSDLGGLTMYNGKTFSVLNEALGLVGNVVNSIYEDKAGNIWIGTNDGISKYNGSQIVNFNEKSGLSSNIIESFIEDDKGNIWCGTAKGLCVILNNINNKELPKIIQFKSEDGLKSESFFLNSALLDSKNRMWWGNGEALTMLDMNEFKFNETKPRVQLSNLFIQGNYYDFNAFKVLLDSNKVKNENTSKIKFSEVENFCNYPLNLELPYKINHLTFNFNAIDWYAPNQVNYQFMLEGLDEDWSSLTAETKADYRNLPYGVFTFKVKAIGSANLWSDTFEYTFTIHPPWWRTWWANTGYVILAIILINLIVWLNSRRLRANANELKERVNQATVEIRSQKDLIEEKHKEITDSINYAERIQRSFLATKEMLDENLNDYFIFFKPKAVVSGDFYWASVLDDGNFAIVTADSTGHGVPGAIMSILNISSLELAIKEKLVDPAAIFNYVRNEIINRFKNDKSGQGGKDGMDASLFVLDKKALKISYAAANNPIWIVRNKELIELKPDRMPIGKYDNDHIPFSKNEVEVQKGDIIYTITDGMPDQFGGEKGKKFKTIQLKELLVSISDLPMEKQKELVIQAFTDWIGDLEQVDDVTVIGVKI